MSFFRGQDVVIKVKVSDAQTQIEQLRNVSIETSVSLMDSTCLMQEARTRVAGLEDYTLSFALAADSTLATHAPFTAGTEFEWEGYFEGETDGRLLLSGTAVLESDGLSGEIDALVEKQLSATNQLGTGLGREAYTPPE